jgi:probable rRNA maturation factor
MKTITVLNSKGKRREIEVASIEVPLAEGRSLRIAFPPGDIGDLVVEAHAEAGSPVMLVQPGAANLATLHVLAVEAPAEKTVPTPLDLELEVQKELSKEEKADVPSKADIRRWVLAALETDAEITIRFVGEEEGKELNAEYRGKDSATNVLSFSYSLEPLVTGDLVLSWPVVVREAQEQGKSVAEHLAHLIVHGTLHLQGWDHENDEDAADMEEREGEILAALGYEDPYAGEE